MSSQVITPEPVVSGARKAAIIRLEIALAKSDLKGNNAMPTIEVNPRTFQVRIDGVLVREDPVSVVPLAQRYTMF